MTDEGGGVESGQWGGASCPTVGQFLRSQIPCAGLIKRYNCEHVNPTDAVRGEILGQMKLNSERANGL